jgi:prefoldin beta subunit
MAENIQKLVMDFEQNRNSLLNVSSQKQQMQIQSKIMEEALEELGKTTEKKVYKIVGNILILSETAAVKKELSENKEATDLRVKTLQKQEDSFVDKLNKLKSEIEAAQKELMAKDAKK